MEFAVITLIHIMATMSVVFLYTNMSQEGKVLRQFEVNPCVVVTRTSLREFVHFKATFDKRI